jgi:hypothetical protein
MTRHPLLLLPLVLALSACGGDSPSASSESPGATTAAVEAAAGPLPKACALIDAARAQVVLGQPAGLMGDDPENCVWASQGHPGSIAMLMVQISEESSEDDAKTLFDAMASALGGTNGGDDALQGLGDQAWRTRGNLDAVSARAIAVRKGRRVLVLNVTGMRTDAGLDARLEQAARDTLTKL